VPHNSATVAADRCGSNRHRRRVAKNAATLSGWNRCKPPLPPRDTRLQEVRASSIGWIALSGWRADDDGWRRRRCTVSANRCG
jgi:hypothetical protein